MGGYTFQHYFKHLQITFIHYLWYLVFQNKTPLVGWLWAKIKKINTTIHTWWCQQSDQYNDVNAKKEEIILPWVLAWAVMDGTEEWVGKTVCWAPSEDRAWTSAGAHPVPEESAGWGRQTHSRGWHVYNLLAQHHCHKSSQLKMPFFLSTNEPWTLYPSWKKILLKRRWPGSPTAPLHPPALQRFRKEYCDQLAKVFYLTHGCMCVSRQSCLTSLLPHDCPAGSSSPWDSLGKSIGVGCRSFSRASFLTQGSNCISCIAGRFPHCLFSSGKGISDNNG